MAWDKVARRAGRDAARGSRRVVGSDPILNLSMQLASLTQPELVFPELPGGDRDAVFRFVADRFEDVLGLDADIVYRGLVEREELGSTGIGGGVAVPHCRIGGLENAVLAVGISSEGVDFGAADGEPVRLLFFVVSPEKDPQQNLRFLSAVSRWVRAEGNVEEIVAVPSRPAMLEILSRELPDA